MAKIVHLANFYGPKSGGLKTMMVKTAEHAVEMGHEVHHIIPGKADETIQNQDFTQHIVKARTIPRSGGYRMITRVAYVTSPTAPPCYQSQIGPKKEVFPPSCLLTNASTA